MSKAWQQTLLSSGLPLENDIFAHMVKRGCVGRFEYSYLKPNENSIDREFSYDVDASYIRGPYFMNLMIECKYRHPGARWVFAPAEYGGSDELEANDFLHVIDDFMAPKFGFRHHFPRRLAPLCSKGIELLSVRLAHVLQVPTAFLYCDNDEMSQMILAFHRAPKAARRHALAVLQGQE